MHHTPHHAAMCTSPPHLRRLPNVVTLHSSIFCEVALMACWMWDESGSLGSGLLWSGGDSNAHTSGQAAGLEP